MDLKRTPCGREWGTVGKDWGGLKTPQHASNKDILEGNISFFLSNSEKWVVL